MDKSNYMENHRGNLVPLNRIKPVDRLRDDLVKRIVERSKSVSDVMFKFKNDTMGEINTFTQMSALKYGTTYGETKGNIQLLSFDGRYKVVKSVNEYIVFDERLQIAKKLIDECINDWFSSMSGPMLSHIKALINNAFMVDQAGKINTDRVLGLRRLSIDDKKWMTAMDAISDSVQVTGSKEYIRVYERRENGKYEQIPLDLSAV